MKLYAKEGKDIFLIPEDKKEFAKKKEEEFKKKETKENEDRIKYAQIEKDKRKEFFDGANIEENLTLQDD